MAFCDLGQLSARGLIGTCDAVDSDAAIGIAKSLVRTLDMPQEPDVIRVYDGRATSFFVRRSTDTEEAVCRIPENDDRSANGSIAEGGDRRRLPKSFRLPICAEHLIWTTNSLRSENFEINH